MCLGAVAEGRCAHRAAGVVLVKHSCEINLGSGAEVVEDAAIACLSQGSVGVDHIVDGPDGLIISSGIEEHLGAEGSGGLDVDF